MSESWTPRPVTAVHMNGHVGTVEFGNDSRLVVWFFTKAEQLGAKSQELGRPVFEDRDYVHVQQPGERDFVERPANQSDKMRWPEKWAAYQNQREQMDEGTPLSVLFPAEPAIVEMMKHMRVHTAEHLANLSEHGIDQIGMGARTYVARAKRYLEESKAAAPFSKMQAELDDMHARNAALEDKLSQALKRIDALETEPEQPRRGRGRSTDA